MVEFNICIVGYTLKTLCYCMYLCLNKVKHYARGRQPTARGPDAAGQGILPGPRPFIVIRPATFFFFNERYAAINRRNDSHLIFLTSPSNRPKKGLNFWRRPLFVCLVITINSAEERPEYLAKVFFFGLRHLFVRKKA